MESVKLYIGSIFGIPSWEPFNVEISIKKSPLVKYLIDSYVCPNEVFLQPVMYERHDWNPHSPSLFFTLCGCMMQFVQPSLPATTLHWSENIKSWQHNWSFTQTSTLTACDSPGPVSAPRPLCVLTLKGHWNKLVAPVAPLKEQTSGNAALWT